MERRIPIIWALAFVMGCQGSSKNVEGDVSTDTTPDTTLDAAPDTALDAQPDTALDGTADPLDDDVTVEDAPPDATLDTEPDTSSDVLPDGASFGQVGDPCDGPEDCLGVPGLESCLTVVPYGTYGYIEYPGGYCTADCLTDDDCGDGALCVGSMGGMAICLVTCVTNADCREDEGYVCRGRHDDPQTFCQPPRPPRPDAEDEPDAPDDVLGDATDVPDVPADPDDAA